MVELSQLEADDEKDLIALIWVHGFKGTDVTFEDLPPRILSILKQTHPSLRVQSHVFPAYQTRGDLNAATENFVEWLATKVVQLENNAGKGRGAGTAKVILMGHSMGGLLIADAASRIAANTRLEDPLWPNVVATIAFDTPYLGLHPHVFKYQLSQAAGHVETARSVAQGLAMLSPLAVGFGFGKAKQAQEEAEQAKKRSADKNQQPSSSPSPSGSGSGTPTTWWKSSAMVGLGALAALSAAAAGTAYYRREDLALGWKWGYDHMTFVRNLWDIDGLKTRMLRIDELSRTRDIVFANFFTCLPPTNGQTHRTFAILPPKDDPTTCRWFPQNNSVAKDEVSAHMGMFNPRENDGFYDLGLAVTRLIAERVDKDGVQPASLDEKMIDADPEDELLL